MEAGGDGMHDVNQVLEALRKRGSEQTRKIFTRHGLTGNVYGVTVADLKVIAKRIAANQALACELYDTGNYDAMYLAGLVADGAQMTKRQLDGWAKSACWQVIAEYTVPWVASESPHAHSLAKKWIDAKREHIAAAGWNTYSGIVATTPDAELDLAEIRSLLKRIEAHIDTAPNRVRYTMNGFVIAVGAYVTPLARAAKATARRVGKVEVEMHGTSCKVPSALDYIAKIEKRGRAGKKRKTIRC